MPGMYQPGEYDLAGFCVGIVEKNRIIDGTKINSGDCVLGLASSGLHSNGYSLARAIVERSNTSLDDSFGQTTLGETLLRPTRIYAQSILKTSQTIDIHGIAHITGGGLPENIPRILPQGLQCQIDAKSWVVPEIFNWLQDKGAVDDAEMLRTFNCGIGMVLIVAKGDQQAAVSAFESCGETVYTLGEIVRGEHGVVIA